jgi:hypothetical protein
MRPPTKGFDRAFHERRLGIVERTVWRIEVDIFALMQERDGDYHLVLRGASGQTMIAEIPTPQKKFVGASPWLANMRAARKAIDDKLVKPLSPHSFVQMEGTLVPRESLSLSAQPLAMAAPATTLSFSTPAEGQAMDAPTFKTKVPLTPARITGVGFFDRVHDQTGVSLFNGIELHPILKIEWL